MSTFTHTIRLQAVFDDGTVINFDHSSEIPDVLFAAQGGLENDKGRTIIPVGSIGQEMFDVLALKSNETLSEAIFENDDAEVFSVMGERGEMFILHTHMMGQGDSSLNTADEAIAEVSFNSSGLSDYAAWSFLSLNNTLS